MSKEELQKIFDNTVQLSYKEKVKEIEDYFISIADGENIVGDGKGVVYPDHLCSYKHFFPEGVYIREMTIKKGQLIFSAIHKKSYALFLLSGLAASSKEDGIEEFVGPCYVISPQGAKRVFYALEDCVVVTVHANPTNTQDLDELAKMNVVFNWKEYEEYIKQKK